jgi:hypothetical protein
MNSDKWRAIIVLGGDSDRVSTSPVMGTAANAQKRPRLLRGLPGADAMGSPTALGTKPGALATFGGAQFLSWHFDFRKLSAPTNPMVVPIFSAVVSFQLGGNFSRARKGTLSAAGAALGSRGSSGGGIGDLAGIELTSLFAG